MFAQQAGLEVGELIWTGGDCHIYNDHIEQVKEQTLPDIYANSPVFKKLRDPAQWSGKCAVCEYASVCGGSRSTAFAMTGDPLASDPTCAYVPLAWERQKERR